MPLSNEQSNAITGGLVLIGLGLLFATGKFFPWILFVIGACLLVRALTHGVDVNALNGALWLTGLGLWFALGMGLGLGLVLIGAGSIFSTLVRPTFLRAKPYVDNTME